VSRDTFVLVTKIRISGNLLQRPAPQVRAHAPFEQTSPAAQGLWRFSATYKKQALTGPFLGPTQIHVTYGPAIDRIEQVTDCVLDFQKITCREF
jgi:hypothetical protein